MDERSPAEIQYRKRMQVFWATMVFLLLAVAGTVVSTIAMVGRLWDSQLRRVEPRREWVSALPTVTPPTVGPRERQVLLELRNVLGVRIRPNDPGYSQVWNRDLRPGSVLLSYEGRGRRAPGLVVSSVAHVGLSPGVDATFDSVAEGEASADAEMASRGLERVERPGLLNWGDEVIVHLLRDKGQPVGFRIRARSGNRVFSALVIGVPFEDPGRLETILRPCLDALDSY